MSATATAARLEGAAGADSAQRTAVTGESRFVGRTGARDGGAGRSYATHAVPVGSTRPARRTLIVRCRSEPMSIGRVGTSTRTGGRSLERASAAIGAQATPR